MVIAVNRGGTGQSTYTDGQLLIGNSTGNTLTKATLTAGTNITITNSGGGISIASSAGLTRTSITATAAQTSFTVTYTVGKILVFVNGVLLATSDYTASSGTAVVLGVAASSGDLFDAITW